MKREYLRRVEWRNYGYIEEVKDRNSIEIVYFHQWFNEVTIHGTTRLKAIVEDTKGKIHEVFPQDIRFIEEAK